MDGFVLSEALWAPIEPGCLGKLTDSGRSGGNKRLFVGSVVWIACTGSAWCDLPAVFGNWSAAYRRFTDWREADIFKRILMSFRTSSIGNTPYSMPPLSKFTGTARA